MNKITPQTVPDPLAKSRIHKKKAPLEKKVASTNEILSDQPLSRLTSNNPLLIHFITTQKGAS
jgi:hypothetical protein